MSSVLWAVFSSFLFYFNLKEYRLQTPFWKQSFFFRSLELVFSPQISLFCSHSHSPSICLTYEQYMSLYKTLPFKYVQLLFISLNTYTCVFFCLASSIALICFITISPPHQDCFCFQYSIQDIRLFRCSVDSPTISQVTNSFLRKIPSYQPSQDKQLLWAQLHLFKTCCIICLI